MSTQERTPLQIREELGFDQRSWARVLGVSLKTVERWDIGGQAKLGLAAEIFRAINKALDAGVPGDAIHNMLDLGLGAFIATELLAKKRR